MKTIRTILPKNQGIFFDIQKKEGKTSFLLHASAFMFLGIHAPVSNAVYHPYSSSSNCGSLLIIFCSPCTSSDNTCRSIGLPSNNTNPKFLLLIQIIHSYWNNYDLLAPFCHFITHAMNYDATKFLFWLFVCIDSLFSLFYCEVFSFSFWVKYDMSTIAIFFLVFLHQWLNRCSFWHCPL